MNNRFQTTETHRHDIKYSERESWVFNRAKQVDRITAYNGFNPERQVISYGHVIFHSETLWLVKNQKFYTMGN
ncbi:hypothetical protein [Candidatus Lokiarchaeum ossiferum]